ncbi:hypothetical protein BH11ACT4_BH11ACT4_13060 [soil metagenome]
MVAEHPDTELVRATQHALDVWLRTPATSPTSQVSGGGAIAHAEARLSAALGDRPVLLTPSASYALWVALRVLGIGSGDEVLVPGFDWTAGAAAVRATGALPVVVPVDRATLTIDPTRAASLRTARTRAVIATHVLGIPADVPALRCTLPWVPILEDCAQAFGSQLDGQPVGTLGDAAVFSFGPGKRIDAGELGALVLRDRDLWESAVRMSTHPIRQQHSGMAEPDPSWLSIRPHPLAAILLAVALERDDASKLIDARHRLATHLRDTTRLTLLGVDGRRRVASSSIPVDPADPALPTVSDHLRVGSADLFDIDSVLTGRPTSRRVALIASRPRHPAERG